MRKGAVILLLLFYVCYCCTYTNAQGIAEAVEEEEDPAHSYESFETSSLFIKQYDYIVVGLGQGGSAAAGRLSEHGTVLGIEAGPVTHRELGGKDYVASRFEMGADGKLKVLEPHTRFDVPSFATTIYADPTPYEQYPAYINGVLQSSIVGKLLGGSGAHNGMTFTRFEKATIDSWGIDGWSWNDVLKYYKKQENVTGSLQAAFVQNHGFAGPVQVIEDAIDEGYEAVPILLAACGNTGLNQNPNLNSPDKTGCGRPTYNIRRGVRDSAARAYLPKALKGGNFTMEVNAQVTKILIRNCLRFPFKPEAYGVQYVKNGAVYQAFAKKEIVLAASTILTPKLLMLSGIGDAALLKSLGIKVWVNNTNVGRGLQSNHVGIGRFEYPNSTYPNGVKMAQHATDYGLHGTGPWAHAGNMMSAYAYSSPNITRGRPDTWVSTIVGGGLGLQDSLRYVIDTIVSTNNPKVRGRVYISSNDPFAPPNITLNDYEFQEDVNAMVYGYKLLRKIFSTYPANTIFGQELIPGPLFQSDEALEYFVRNYSFARGHWVGTAKLGNPGDRTAVVDPKMRVLGVDNLRVGDCSVLLSTNSHSSASCNMAGERVAAFITE